MAHRSPRPASPSSIASSLPHHHPELAQQMEQFQKAVQALLDLYESPEREEGQPPVAKPGGEIRCFYVPAKAVQLERELVRLHHGEDFQDLLTQAHMLLTGLVKVMKSTPHEIRVKGYTIASLGFLLEQASALLLRMRNVYDKVEKVSP